MIQRVQSIYYALAMICVSIASFGANIYVFQGSETRYEFNAFGISEFTTSDNVDALSPMPYYIVGICLILLSDSNTRFDTGMGLLIAAVGVPVYYFTRKSGGGQKTI